MNVSYQDLPQSSKQLVMVTESPKGKAVAPPFPCGNLSVTIGQKGLVSLLWFYFSSWTELEPLDP